MIEDHENETTEMNMIETMIPEGAQNMTKKTGVLVIKVVTVIEGVMIEAGIEPGIKVRTDMTDEVKTEVESMTDENLVVEIEGLQDQEIDALSTMTWIEKDRLTTVNIILWQC